MESPNRADAEKGEMRAKLQSVVDKAQEVCERLQEQTSAAAKATDKTIRENPYQAMGVAFGVGVLVGVLVMWTRRE